VAGVLRGNRVFVRIVQKFCSLGLKRLGALVVLSVVAVPAVFGVCVRYWPTSRKNAAVAAMVDPVADLAPTVNFSAADVAAAASAGGDDATTERQLYPYSIIPGGIRNAAELRAAEVDDSVRGHYAGLNLANARMARLEQAKFVYVSYRRGSKIFWTKNVVRLPKGERVITDGEVTLRARCGNRISELPMAPVEGQEAAVPAEAMELPPADVAAVPLPPIGPTDVAMVPPAGTETAMLIPPGDTTPGASPSGPSPYVPPGFWIPPGGGPSTTGSKTPPTPPSGPGTPSGPGAPPSGPGTPPSGPGTPPSGPGAPPSGPGTPPSGPSTPPITTPEPAELAMLAAGVGSVVVAGLRRKHNA
jgi:hypothetical protein